jgi:CO/xanthine dehydrogenase Mo-binding subunit
LLSSTYADYWVPTAADLPPFQVDYVQTLSTFNVLGARGVGEGGGSPLIAVVNAVENALAPLGITLQDSHLSPEHLLRQITESRTRTPTTPKSPEPVYQARKESDSDAL